MSYKIGVGNALLVALLMGCCCSRLGSADSTALAFENFQFAQEGPYETTTFRDNLELERGGPLEGNLALTITLPVVRGGGDASGQAFPVIFFYSGFQASASWYKEIVDRISSWGYIIVQYDTPFFSLPSSRAEVQIFPQLLSWVEQHLKSRFAGGIDLDSIATVGHSRGGKIAALIYANNTNVKTAWLIDPVDQSTFAPESEENPLAAKALQSKNLSVGITGAGVISSCNPLIDGTTQYEAIYEAAADGSWKVVIPGASHFTFAEAGRVIDLAFDTLCRPGRVSRDATVPLTTAPMLMWLNEQLCSSSARATTGNSQACIDEKVKAEFKDWIEDEEQSGLLTFQVKGSDLSLRPERRDLLMSAA